MYILIFYIILIIAGLFFVSNSFDITNKITYLPENFAKGFDTIYLSIKV